MNDSDPYPPLRVQDLAAGERPQERLERLGPGALSDAELLAMLLRTGSRGHNVLTVAQRLVAEGGSLAALTKWTETDFRRLTGIGRVKALQLQFDAAVLNDPEHKAALDQLQAARSRLTAASGQY